VAVKLVIEDAEGDDDSVEAAESLWRAVRIVVIADIVMSLDNVIAMAASAEIAAAQVDIAHAAASKATLMVFGLATSIPLIVAGSAILMALLERYRVLVWAGGALLGWGAGGLMETEAVLPRWLGNDAVQFVHTWAKPLGAIFVVAVGYALVRRHRPLNL